MSRQMINDDALRTFLKTSRSAIADQQGADWFWYIDGVQYPEAQALKLAEYCLITGQKLTSIATVDGALNLARRAATSEEGIANLNLVITELKGEIETLRKEITEIRTKPRWRRGW